MFKIKKKKRVRFYTLGCKVNQYETQSLREQFLIEGFKENNSVLADVYVVNTCTVTAQADAESRRLIRKIVRTCPESKILVTGCCVEKDAAGIQQISERIRIVPNQQKHRIYEYLDFTGKRPEARQSGQFTPLEISGFKDHERAFVKIQDGCNNFCSYCKVPLVRGRSRSRSLRGIITEAERLVGSGFKEIVLTGICLGDYHYENFDLADVITLLEELKGKFRIRLSSIEAQLISNKLLESFKLKKLCPHLHIPLQSADNAILKKMNRQYTAKDYLSLIAKIKKKVENIAITTDVLVGFPGEKKKNFHNTVRSLKEILPLRTHIFSFSPREGTKAFSLPERIAPQEVKERVNLLKEAAAECSYKFRKGFLGRQLSVLIESKTDQENGFFCGYSENYIRVIVENAQKENINTLLPVKVKAVDVHSTQAKSFKQNGYIN